MELQLLSQLVTVHIKQEAFKQKLERQADTSQLSWPTSRITCHFILTVYKFQKEKKKDAIHHITRSNHLYSACMYI